MGVVKRIFFIIIIFFLENDEFLWSFPFGT